jgi:hypothetical protein
MKPTAASGLSRRSLNAALAAPLASLAVPTLSVLSQEVTSRMPRIIVFDVNETLLDVAALRPHFARAFGDALVLREWFSTVLLYSEVASLAG